ncbi:MAG: hypothetical protein JXO22_03985 [Phycisphaerae bacterium]|nr:hypothetical protein [Phycisphaerae bacterium]
MAEAGSNTILSEDEIEAALSEIESMPGGLDDIPDLDDGLTSKLTPAPKEPAKPRPPAKQAVPPPANAPAMQTPDAAPVEAAESSDAAERVAEMTPADEVTPAPEREGWAAKIKRVIATRLRRVDADEDVNVGFSARNPHDWLQLAGTSLDKMLDLVNRPFQWMKAETRQVVGLIALVTLTFSLIVALAGPRLAPSNSAVEFIQQKRAELVMKSPLDAARAEQP